VYHSASMNWCINQLLLVSVTSCYDRLRLVNRKF